MRHAIRGLVEEIVPCDHTEAEHRIDVLRWLDRGDEIYRTAKPATPPKHLVAYSVLVDTSVRQILLVNHRDAQRWLPTGGHVEPDEHPADTASRELLEELGLSPEFHPAVGPTPLMVTVTPTRGRSEPHVDVSLWFVFDGASDAELTPDETEFSGTRWWQFEDVRHGGSVAFDPHLPRFIDKFQDRLVR
ncbi:MAG: NUDIX domain-containing protein [Ilumatobacteraceae bacterium]